MYAIINAKTGKFVFGTDRRYHPWRQRTSKNCMLTYDSLCAAQSDFMSRKCGKDYKIAVLKTPEVKLLMEPPKSWDDIVYDK